MKFRLTFPPKAVLPTSVAKLLKKSQSHEQWKGRIKMELLFVTIEASDVSYLPEGGLSIKIGDGIEVKENHGNGSRVLEILADSGKILIHDKLCQQCYELTGKTNSAQTNLQNALPVGFVAYECEKCHGKWVAKNGLRV